MKKITRSNLSSFATALFLTASTCVSAAPLSLATKPLIVSQVVDPNVMILFDTSGSMNDNAVWGDYDSSITYVKNCPNELSNSDSYKYYASVASDGTTLITRYGDGNGDAWQWGVNGSYFCFDKNDNYQFYMVKDDGSLHQKEFTVNGNLLNWYFSNSDQTGPANFGAGNVQREGVGTRNQIARKAMYDLVGEADDEDRMQNVRVGVAGFRERQYDYSQAQDAYIYVKLKDIDNETNRQQILTAINNLPSGGSTPLVSAYASLGRYFTDGHTGEDLDLSSSVVDTGTIAPSNLFSNSPYYNDLGTPVANEVMQYSCQKNFIIAMTDGAPNGDYLYSEELARWGDGTVDYENDGDWSQTQPTTSPGDFDDVAKALYDLDLRPTTYPNDKNNVITYPVAFSLDLPMMERAANFAKSKYFTASNSSELNASLKSIINDVKAQVGTFGSVAFNSGQLSSDSAIYQAQFNTAAYSGSLFAFELSDTGDLPEDPSWNAATKLNSLTPANRVIFTLGDVNSSAEGVLFNWDSLTTAQKDDLGYTADGTDDTLGQSVLDYIRGDRTAEGSESDDLRVRDGVLGDIVNSTPVFVGAPELNWPDHDIDPRFGSSTKFYSAFKTAKASRTEMIYVGANDGMLHGFSADVGTSGGVEKLAYIPGAIYSSASAADGLHYLADQDYDHKFYVDLTPTVSDVFINGDWKTVLVGGLRAGGRGLFALDITNPASFANTATAAENTVMWEFTNAVDGDFGYTYSEPTIALMPNGRWAVIVGNGYNSDNEQAHLFIIFLDGGIDGEWTDGSAGTAQDYIKLSTDTSITSNGLSSPRVVDLDNDHVADRIYAGDLQGNMWVFDVSSTTASNWGSAYVDGSTPEPLFTAHNGTSPQQITSPPVLVRNSTYSTVDSNEPNLLVLFGTGKFLEPSDTSANTDLMSFYSVWDKGADGLARSDLQSREVITDSSRGLRTIAGDNIDWTSQYGWYMDLENQASVGGTVSNLGERVVSAPLVRREVLLFNTIIPDDVICSGGGRGWLMSVNYLTGKAPAFAVFDANNDGDIDSSDIGYAGQQFLEGLPSRSGVLGDNQYTPGSSGDISQREIEVGKGSREGRLSWEEVFRN